MPIYNDDELVEVVKNLIAVRTSDALRLDRIKAYTDGVAGLPSIPDDAPREIKELAELSRKNVLGLVVNSFVENLSVRGYHRADASENEPVWHIWTRNRMTARQAEVYRAALTYGVSYVTVLPSAKGPVFRTNSPRQMVAVYADPSVDLFPEFALEVYAANVDGATHRMGMLLDSENVWTIDFGVSRPGQMGFQVESISEPVPHGATYDGEPVTPVVRFVNAWDSEDSTLGEVEPLLTEQRSINQTSFFRSVVEKYGAIPHKVLIGVEFDEDDEMISPLDGITQLPDPESRIDSWPAAQLEPYTGVLKEKITHVAMVAQISPMQFSGDMVNLSADAIARADQNHQRKLRSKQDSFGDSWLVCFRLAADFEGDDITAADDAAVISWRPTESRTLGQTGDFLVKAGQAGIPVDELLDLIPGLTQQKVVAIKNRMAGNADMTALIQGLAQLGTQEGA